ncbi:hypothetical protein BDBG_05390 [Blastomyces gilchristii SLH14081]|uniref:Uncharacterized protein n=1 Tax=Blastomyces gilchristii (strain SLH14081) TaxID=559298 RepID=A0A179UPA0_BLAGS|nr:uncharacterized protein BDBG_05390 [Blastomyces gilchristii SLH14081]OAT09653.1 hypothetical protein BDBG_05390 [Blastomyces gilchristii SLH14081]
MYIYPFVRIGNSKPSAYPRPSSETGRVITKQIIEKENESRSLFTPTKNYKPKSTFSWTLPNRLPTDLFSTVQQVLSEVQEARRLKQQVDSLLHPNERQWIDTTIAETDTTANEIAVLLEPRRVAREIGQGGKIGLRNRLRWALRDSHRAKEKTSQLVLSRNSLMVVLGNLHMRGSTFSPASKPSTPKPPSITTITSPAELDSLSIFAASRKEGCEVKVKRGSSLSDELNEILAWRRTKGAWSISNHELTGFTAVDSTSSPSYFSTHSTTNSRFPLALTETRIGKATMQIKRKPVPAGPIPTIEEYGSRSV